VSRRRPRWDTDARGIGVADAGAWQPTIATLSALVMEHGWVAEEPEAHLWPHLAAAASADGRLRLTSATTGPTGEFVVELDWIGDPTPGRRDRRTALYALVGSIAESVTVIRDPSGSAGDELEVLTGGPPGDSPFGSHGHTIRLRLIETPQTLPPE
jgi:hypothetical protein